MKRILKLIAIVLILALMAPSVAAATADSVMPMSSAYIASYSVYLSMDGNTVYSCFRVSAMKYLAELGATEIVLQESTDGVNWYDVATYSYTNPLYTNMIGSNKKNYNSNVAYENGIEGYYYRALVTVWGGDGNGNGDAFPTYTAVKQL